MAVRPIQTSTDRRSGAHVLRRLGPCIALVVSVFFATPIPQALARADDTEAVGEAAAPPQVPDASDTVFSVDSPVGPIQYRAGRGLSIPRAGLHVGGFGTVELNREEGQPGEFALDGINFLLLFQPVEFFRAFAELEVGDLFQVQTDGDETKTDPTFTVERLYGDFSLGDPWNLRVGKFQTPVGRWNLTPAEPFTWTASDPAVFERAFDEHQTGAAFFGSVYPRSNTLRYWLYGQFVDPLDPDSDPPAGDRSAGGRLELGDPSRGWSVGSSFLATDRNGDWSWLGGLDGQLWFDRLELTSEFVFERGDIGERRLWDVWVQAVYEVLPGFHLVGRYERFDPTGSDDADVFDLGVAWLPVHWIVLKADYRLSDHQNDEVRRGLSMSFSVLF